MGARHSGGHPAVSCTWRISPGGNCFGRHAAYLPSWFYGVLVKVRWVIACGVLAAAVATGVAAWALSRSSGGRSEFATPRAALISVCHADASRLRDTAPPPGHGPEDDLAYTWSARGLRPGRAWVANLERTSIGKYKVDQCKAGRETGVHSG